MYVNLLKLCNQFYKFAGIIKLPIKTLSEINEFVLSLFSQSILEYKENLNEDFVNYLKSFITEKYKTDNIYYTITTFVVDLENEKYFYGKYIPYYLKYLDVFVNKKTDDFGNFIPDLNRIIIFIPDVKYINNITDFKNYVNIIKESIEHELTHYIQYCMREIFKKDTAGFAGKKYINKERNQDNLPHHKQDIEFYALLKNNISMIKKHIEARLIYKKNKEEMCKAAVGLQNVLYENILKDLSSLFKDETLEDKRKILKFTKFISNNPVDFFKSLKEDDQEKWKLSVKLLWKEMENW